MAMGKKTAQLALQVMEQLLENDYPNDALSGSLELLVKALGAEAGAIWLRDGETEEYFSICYVGPADLTGISFRKDRYAEGETASDGKSRLIADVRAEGAETAFGAAGMDVRNLLCVPLKSLQDTVGTMALANRKDGKPFTQEDLELCERMASLAAITMEEKGYRPAAVRRDMEVLIETRGLCKDYPSGEGTLRVLHGINLRIFKGEFVVILGESGCGKSTLVNIIAGMDDLTEGTLTIGGRDFSHPSDSELTAFRRNDVGFVFQNYNLMPNLTALENIQFLAELVSEPMDARDALEKVGLGDRADHYPSMLSGGQQQRVSIARAIVKKPKMIFADEPTAALDYQTSVEVLEVFEEIVRSQSTTVVMITHNSEIARIADRVIQIRNGKVSGIRVNREPARARDLVW